LLGLNILILVKMSKFSGIFVLAIFLILSTSAVFAQEDGDRDEFIYGTFPSGFIWGLATSSYQIEGAWEEDGKGKNIWDTFAHENSGEHIADRTNGDVACDSYHKINEDVEALQNLGANFYRFSISWSRILPTGTLAGGVNPAGIAYYNRLIDALLAAGITPFVTLYHWDLPQPLEDLGGWLNDGVVYHYGDYARILFDAYGDRVKNWITFNEPSVFCGLGYEGGSHAPGKTDNQGISNYKCGNVLLKAHGLAYRIYEKDFKPTQGGKVGITINSNWNEPKNRDDPEHLAASERAMQFSYGQYASPLLRGAYPAIMRELVDAKSAAEGRNESRLPSFDTEWTSVINGTVDFLGVNHYTTNYISPGGGDSNTLYETDPSWEHTGAPWLDVVPWGFRRLLTWISNEYKGIEIYVTENGSADLDTDGIADPQRVSYYRRYINEMLKAVNDGANVKGYTAWSLMDNFEWAAGYTQRFGVHYIDFNDPNLTRVQKDSAVALKTIFADNGFPDPNGTVYYH